MKELLYTENMKLSDLISSKSYLILMLPRFGIHLGFGDKSVKEVCDKHGIDTAFFLLICNVYSFNDYLPDKDTIISTDMHHLVPYLRASHAYYLDKRIPHIATHLDHIANELPDKTAAVLRHFFAEYHNEVAAHFGYEEKNLFPHIESMLNTGTLSTYRIKSFISAHSNIEDKLDDLTQIIFKYLPQSTISDEAISVVFDILQLSHDLKKHTLIEEKILVPYVQTLEKKLK